MDKNSKDILNFINKNGTTSIEQIKDKFNTINNIQDIIDFLQYDRYISGLTPKYCAKPGLHTLEEVPVELKYFSPYKITPKGKSYLESHLEQNKEYKFGRFHTRINTVLVLLTLIISIASLIMQLQQS